MYSNLKNILYQKNISVKQYAEFLGVDEKTVQNKLEGIIAFTYLEFKKTCMLLSPEFNADFLFSESQGDEGKQEKSRELVGIK